jgi:outer membrane protein
MNRKRIFIIALFLCAAGFSTIHIANGQTISDSLSLSKIISNVLLNNPTLKESTEAINQSDASIGLAKTAYMPNFDVTANFTRIGPVTTLTFPGLGEFSLFPANNYGASLNYTESIYDFGKTKQNITYATESKYLSVQAIEQVKQKLALAAIVHYYSLLYMQEAILINKEDQKTLQEHLEFIQKKQASGTATQYEILSTQVKISAAENKGIELEAELNNQINEINTLMGLTQNSSFAVKKDLIIDIPVMPDDSLVSFALKNRDEMIVANEKSSISAIKYNVVKAQNNPSLAVYASGGTKNGYLPELNSLKANFTAGIGLKIPLYDAGRSKYNLMQAKSQSQVCTYEIDVAKLSVINDVHECSENLRSSIKSITHYRLQLSQAEEAFALAKTNYKAGSITNLDLLDAATTVSESKLLLYKSEITNVLNAYKLKAAIGQRLY